MTEQICKNCTNWTPPTPKMIGPYEREGDCATSVTHLKTLPRDTCLLFEVLVKQKIVMFPGEDEH